MTFASWTREFNRSLLVGIFCVASGSLGLAIGMGISAVEESTTIRPVQTGQETAIMAMESQVEFFPSLERVEAAVEQARKQAIIRREATRQQELIRTKEVLTFHGATEQDITNHVKRQLMDSQTNQ